MANNSRILETGRRINNLGVYNSKLTFGGQGKWEITQRKVYRKSLFLKAD